MRPPPVGPQKAVHTVVANREGVDIDATERAAELFDGRKVWAIDLDDLGEVVVDQPEARGRWSAGEDHNAPSGDARELAETACRVRPMVHRENGESRLERGVPERELGRGRLNCRSAPDPTLTNHRHPPRPRIDPRVRKSLRRLRHSRPFPPHPRRGGWPWRSEEHTSELQSRLHLVCRLLLEKKKHTILE